MIEEWRPVEHSVFGQAYEVSDLGRVRHLPHGNIIKPCGAPGGYVQYSLYVDGERWQPTGHRLVALAFLPNPKALPQVHHVNFIKADNRAANLQWVTASENQLLSMPVCEKRHGALHYRAKLTEDDVRAIRRRRAEGQKLAVISAAFGVTEACVSSVANRKTWGHVAAS